MAFNNMFGQIGCNPCQVSYRYMYASLYLFGDPTVVSDGVCANMTAFVQNFDMSTRPWSWAQAGYAGWQFTSLSDTTGYNFYGATGGLYAAPPYSSVGTYSTGTDTGTSFDTSTAGYVPAATICRGQFQIPPNTAWCFVDVAFVGHWSNPNSQAPMVILNACQFAGSPGPGVIVESGFPKAWTNGPNAQGTTRAFGLIIPTAPSTVNLSTPLVGSAGAFAAAGAAIYACQNVSALITAIENAAPGLGCAANGTFSGSATNCDPQNVDPIAGFAENP